MSNTVICYFPETDEQQSLVGKPKVTSSKSFSQASQRSQAHKLKSSQSIAYFPDFNATVQVEDGVIADPWLTPVERSEIPPEAIQALRHHIDLELVLDQTYTEAIATLKTLAGQSAQVNELLETIINTTLITTAQAIRSNPAIVELDHPKAPWLSFIAATEPDAQQLSSTTSKATKERHQKLIKIGQLLKQARQKQGLSIHQLSQNTHILTHHIAAIEAGNMQRLPEDLYVRGFVRHLGNALKLDGDALADTLSPTQSKPNLSSSAVSSPTVSETVLPVRHSWVMAAVRYIGYGLLVTGSVSFLSWSIAQQQMRSIPLQPSLSDLPNVDQVPNHQSPASAQGSDL